jgi:hypothetical protein
MNFERWYSSLRKTTQSPSITHRSFANGAKTVNATNEFGNVTRYFYDGISRRTRSEVVLTESGSGDGLHVGTDLFGVGTETPTLDTGQGGGDGLIRTGTVYDRNSLTSSLIDDNGNVTLYLYDNLNRRVTETYGLVVTSTYTESNIFGDRRVITPTVATINDVFSVFGEVTCQFLGASSVKCRSKRPNRFHDRIRRRLGWFHRRFFDGGSGGRSLCFLFGH